ncbi:MAG: CocE/NonD family hydrolase [Calditrichia bacterium]
MCLFPAGLLPARESGYLQRHYNKHEYRIPMRDGITLFTAVFTPKDTSQDFPIMLERTPYSVAPYGNDRFPENIGPWLHLAEEGFIFVFQDVRGRFMSEGDYVNMRPYNPHKKSNKDIDESSDTYDTIDWLVKNIPRNNGRVGMWGISYPGFYAAMGTIDAHPALKAVCPQAPIANWFVGDDFHHNGAFNLPLAFGFFTAFGVPREHLTTHWPPRFDFGTPDGYRFYLDMGPLPNANKKYLKGKIPFWNDLMKHGTYDKFWQVRNTLQYFHHIKPAVMTVGGWFDAEDCYGALRTYQAIEANNPGIFNILIMGPWYHGGWVRSDGERLGDINFGSKTGEFYVKNMELPFFRYFLKDKGELNLPEAFVFETGSNQWKKFDQWPPADSGEKHLYFAPDGAISFDAPPVAADAKAFDEYVSNPAAPVPFTTQISTRMPKEYMVEDQRFASRRPDVLVYQTDVLPLDLTIAGPVTADLYVSTTGTDADWIVKLIDVYPDTATGEIEAACNNKPGGYQMLLRGDIMRGKFRNSYEKPQAFSPGKITRVEFTMNDVCHSFRKGHRIMVQVQSSWFPLFDLNPQKFMDIYRARESDFNIRSLITSNNNYLALFS